MLQINVILYQLPLEMSMILHLNFYLRMLCVNLIEIGPMVLEMKIKILTVAYRWTDNRQSENLTWDELIIHTSTYDSTS